MVLHHRGATPMRPAWLDRDTEAVEMATEGAELIQAIPAQEGERAVPVAQQRAHGAGQVPFRVPPGRYLLRGLRGSDTVQWRRTMRV